MALPRQVPVQRNPLSDFLGLSGAPGEQPSGVAFNDYLASRPKTFEQQREAGVLSDMDNRAEAGIQHDLQQAEAVRGARAHGFNGSFPLEEQEQAAEEAKLKLATEPHRVAGEYAVKAAESKAAAQADALSTLLQAGGNRSVSVNGVGSVGAAPRPQSNAAGNAALARLLQAKTAAANSKAGQQRSGTMFGLREGTPSPQQTDLEDFQNHMTVAQALIGRYPNAQSAEEILQQTALTPDEQAALHPILAEMIGR